MRCYSICTVPAIVTSDAETITWTEFKDSFFAHFIPADLIELKKQEFRDLTQSNMSVAEYLNHFT
jgi:hypothetical protein